MDATVLVLGCLLGAIATWASVISFLYFRNLYKGRGDTWRAGFLAGVDHAMPHFDKLVEEAKKGDPHGNAHVHVHDLEVHTRRIKKALASGVK